MVNRELDFGAARSAALAAAGRPAEGDQGSVPSVAAARWYVLATDPGCEERLRNFLRQPPRDLREISLFDPEHDVWLPERLAWRYSRRRRECYRRPMLPGYVLLRLDIDRGYAPIIEIPAVHCLLMPGGSPLPVDDEDVRRLRDVEAAELAKTSRRAIAVTPGDKVSVCGRGAVPVFEVASRRLKIGTDWFNGRAKEWISDALVESPKD